MGSVLRFWAFCFIITGFLVFGMAAGAWAEELDEGDWPDETGAGVSASSTAEPSDDWDSLAQPAVEATPPWPQNAGGGQQATTSRLPADPPEVKKPKWWQRPFKPKEAPPPPEEQIVEVGPRRYPQSSGMLLRIPQAIQPAPGVLIPPGFYLAHSQQGDNADRIIRIFQGNRLLAEIPLMAVSNQPAEPVEFIDPDAPPPQSAKAALVDSGALQITFFEGRKRYQSAPIPIQTDSRPQIPSY